MFDNIIRKKGKDINWKELNRDSAWRLKVAKDKRLAANKMRKFITVKLDKCPMCSSDSTLFITVYGYDYYECNKCEHLFMNPTFDKRDIKKLYTQNISKQHKIYTEVFDKRVKQISTPKVEFCNEIIKEKGLWIDIGCGAGELLVSAKNSGWDTLGYEVDSKEIEFAKEQGLNIIPDYLSDSNIKHLSKAKVVSLINVIEHINEPEILLKQIINTIPYNSYLVIETPRHPSLSSFVNFIFPDIVYRHIHPPEHLHIFSEQSLSILFNNVGIKPVALWEFGQDAGDLISSAGDSRFTEKLMNLAPEIQKIVDEKSMSDVMFTIAKLSIYHNQYGIQQLRQSRSQVPKALNDT